MQLKKTHSATNNMRICTQIQKLKCWCKWSLVSVFLVQKLTYHLFNSKLSVKVPNIIEPITVFKQKEPFYTQSLYSTRPIHKKNIPGWHTVDKLKSNIMVFYGKVYAASTPLSHHFDIKTFLSTVSPGHKNQSKIISQVFSFFLFDCLHQSDLCSLIQLSHPKFLNSKMF